VSTTFDSNAGGAPFGVRARDEVGTDPARRSDVRKSLRIGGDPNLPRACPEAFEQFHAAVGDELAEELVGEMAETAELDSVNIKGETAFLNWHYTDEGTSWR
jgi:hypothetical protein